MANMRKRFQDDGTTDPKRRRKGLIFALIIVVVLALAWFDGGEEPIHPISQEVILSGAD